MRLYIHHIVDWVKYNITILIHVEILIETNCVSIYGLNYQTYCNLEHMSDSYVVVDSHVLIETRLLIGTI